MKIPVKLRDARKDTMAEAERSLAQFVAAGRHDEATMLLASIREAVVPCGTCTACCRSPVEVRPDCGDNLADYETGIYVDTSAPNAPAMVTLLQKPDGACYALKGGRCSIWNKRPYICRQFDCRKIFAMHTKEQRRDLVNKKYFHKAVIDAGKKRLHTLENADELRAAATRLNYGARGMEYMEQSRGVKKP